MSKLRDALLGYRDLGIPKDQACITGSAAIAIWSEIALERGYAPLQTEDREIGDVDICTADNSPVFADVIHNANLAARHAGGFADCVTFDLNGASYDVSCKWPFLVASTHSLDNITAEVHGIKVMTLGWVAECKRRFARPKDLRDLRAIDCALGGS